MEKFTKGRWVSTEIGVCVRVESNDQSDGMLTPIARMEKYDFPTEHKANAALIAAAPEMFEDIKLDIEWLKRLRSFFVLGSDGFRACSLRIESKEKLLAKARGE